MASRIGVARDFSPGFKLNFVEGIIGDLYSKQEEAVQKELQCIALDNRNLQLDGEFAFRYEGRIFPAYPSRFKSWDKKCNLVDELLPQLQLLLKEESSLKMSRLRVSALLGRSINICNTVADLYAIMPEQVHKYFNNTIAIDIDRDRITVTDQQIALYKVENARASEHLVERLMIKMLMEKI